MNAHQMHQDKRCILIIDDDYINREIIKNIFKDDYCFKEAKNGLEGLQLIEKDESCLCAILLDVNMPVMTGLEMLHLIQAKDVANRIPIFLITANEEMEVAREAYELGVMDVINKPVTPFIILRRVQSVIELFQAREKLSRTVHGQREKLKENEATIDELHKTTIEVLASAIEFRDIESGEHTKRIYSITKHLLSNTELGKDFTQNEIENMAIGSIMHDVGKIAISDVILNKPGRLTPDEYETMKKHTVKGAGLLEQLSKKLKHDCYTYACDIAHHHHERWDGKGYPEGLKGDEITIWAQVVSIADVYDALVSPRVYKKAFDPDKAVNMIKNGECGVFNPKLLECFFQEEPEIRKWYQEDIAVEKAKEEKKNQDKESAEQGASEGLSNSRELIDVLLLTAAVQSAYDMIICVNLTQNSFYMMDYDRFMTKCVGNDGVFDDLIGLGSQTVPESHRNLFIEKFSREKLLEAYHRGEKSVELIHPQYTDKGELKTVSTNVLFMEDPRNGDIREITLSRYIDE